MKTRQGFVSNSSSSSFVVNRADWLAKRPRKLLSRQEETKLKKFGFKKTMASYPFQVDIEGWAKAPSTKEEEWAANWTYSVICNQDEPIEFLLENRISFIADVHYEHWSMIYDGKTDKLLIAQNLGKQAQMGGFDKYDFGYWKKVNPLERITGAQYLKRNKQ